MKEESCCFACCLTTINNNEIMVLKKTTTKTTYYLRLIGFLTDPFKTKKHWTKLFETIHCTGTVRQKLYPESGIQKSQSSRSSFHLLPPPPPYRPSNVVDLQSCFQIFQMKNLNCVLKKQNSSDLQTFRTLVDWILNSSIQQR